LVKTAQDVQAVELQQKEQKQQQQESSAQQTQQIQSQTGTQKSGAGTQKSGPGSPEVFLFPRGSSVVDVFEALKNEGKLEGDFVRCEIYGDRRGQMASGAGKTTGGAVSGAASGDAGGKTGEGKMDTIEKVWRVARRDEVLRDSFVIARIMTKKNASWQKK
jgi:hypothetical protein